MTNPYKKAILLSPVFGAVIYGILQHGLYPEKYSEYSTGQIISMALMFLPVFSYLFSYLVGTPLFLILKKANRLNSITIISLFTSAFTIIAISVIAIASGSQFFNVSLKSHIAMLCLFGLAGFANSYAFCKIARITSQGRGRREASPAT